MRVGFVTHSVLGQGCKHFRTQAGLDGAVKYGAWSYRGATMAPEAAPFARSSATAFDAPARSAKRPT